MLLDVYLGLGDVSLAREAHSNEMGLHLENERGCILKDEKRCSGGRLLKKEEKFMIARLRDGNFFEDSFGKLQPQTKILETVFARFLEPDLSNMELC